MKKRLAYLAASFALPALAFAQAITSVQSGAQFVMNFINTIAVPLIFTLAFIVFIFGIFQYFILGRGDEEKAAQGRQLMLWGIIGFFAMLSVWGLVNILVGTFSLNSAVPSYPQAPAH
jgi:hypothetical protein